MNFVIPKSINSCSSSFVESLNSSIGFNATQMILNEMGKYYTCKIKDYISQIVFHYGAIISWIYLATRSLIKNTVPLINPNSYSPGICQSILSHPKTSFLITIPTALAFCELFCVHLHWVLLISLTEFHR